MHSSPSSSLRKQALEGGIYLTVRLSVGLALRLVGLFFLTRIVGPSAYGLYNSASGLFSYLLALGQMGINVYLIRSQEAERNRLFHLAFWWLLLSGGALTLIAIGFTAVVGHFWIKDQEFIRVMISLSLIIPFVMISVVPQSYLERDLEYKKVTAVEMASQFCFYLVAIPLAWSGLGVWALVWGFWASQMALVGGFWLVARYRPAWYWNLSLLKDMLHYSFGQALSGWLYNLRNLAPSMVLLPLAGKEAVGYYALAMRLVDMLTFVSDAMRRLSVPAFARIQHDLARLLRSVNEGMALRLLSICILFALFTIVSPWVLPRILGSRWDAGMLMWVFLLVAIHAFLDAGAGVMASVLYLVRRNRAMIVANVAYITTFFGVSALLTWLLPAPYNLYGYASATWIAKIPNLWIIDRSFRRAVGAPDYRLTLLWTAGFVAIMLAPVVGWWFYLVALPFLANRVSIEAIRMWGRQIRELRRTSPKQDGSPAEHMPSEQSDRL